jgi:hypothetical protein
MTYLKAVFMTLLVYALFTIAIFSQSRDARLDEFIGSSKQQVTKYWGYPEETQTSKTGLLLWLYSNGEDVVRTFYFKNDIVQMAGSMTIVENYSYALELAGLLGKNFKDQGFWLYDDQSTDESVLMVMTDGYSYIDMRIAKSGNNYAFALLAYK